MTDWITWPAFYGFPTILFFWIQLSTIVYSLSWLFGPSYSASGKVFLTAFPHTWQKWQHYWKGTFKNPPDFSISAHAVDNKSVLYSCTLFSKVMKVSTWCDESLPKRNRSLCCFENVVLIRLKFHNYISSVLHTKPRVDFSSFQLFIASQTHMDLWMIRDCIVESLTPWFMCCFLFIVVQRDNTIQQTLTAQPFICCHHYRK